MLPKFHRLPIEGSRNRRGKSIASPYGTLKVFPPLAPHSRFGIVIGRGAAKRAVDRNALRRSFFNAARTVRTALPVADYLFITNPSLATLPRRDLQKMFLKIFRLHS